MPETFYYATGTEVTAIADALRVKGGTALSLVFPDDFVQAIQNLVPQPVLSSLYATPSTVQQTFSVGTGFDGYGNVTVYAMPAGTIVPPTTISGTDATVTAGTNILTFAKTIAVTPIVSISGYVSSGTAGNVDVTLSAAVTTRAASTYYPSTADVTINSGIYLTGTQTIKSVITTNLSASNVVSGVTIKVGDSADDDRIASVAGSLVIQHYYTGSTEPSASLGVNGDIYLKT